MAPKRSHKRKHPAMWLRYVLLGGLLVYVSYIGYMHLQHQTEFPPVDAICPFGGLASLYSLIFHGSYLQRIFISSFILLGATVLLVVFTGRSFCGWICPLGTLQGIVTGLARLVGVKHRLSLNADKNIRWLRLGALVVFTIGAWIGGQLLIRPYDPWVAWMHISAPADVLSEFPIGLAVLIASLVAAVFIARPFCRYLCPMGIFLGLVNRGSLARITVDQDKCIHCMACDYKCPVGIPIEWSTVVNRTECLSCGECIPVCPVPETITFKVGKSTARPLVLGLAIIAIFFGVIGLSKAVGLYRSTPPLASELQAEHNVTPDDIRGYMTLSEVADLFRLNLDSLYVHLDLSRAEVPPDTKGRDIGKLLSTGFETDSIRLVVTAMLSALQSSSNADHAVESSVSSGDLPFIMGTNTLREAAAMSGVSLADLYRELDLDSTVISPDTPCRDLRKLVDPSFHTSRVRDAVAKLKSR